MPQVKPGLDALLSGAEPDLQRELRKSNCALLSNPTGQTQSGQSALSVCRELGFPLRALFSPEHGPRADREGDIESGTEDELPVHSLYGATRRPTPEMLDRVDAVVCDLQDVGARFYTYSSTLFHLLEEAIPRGIRVVVLDRPNPLGGQNIEGPVIDEPLRSFIGYAPLPTTHAMTMGELARFFVAWRELDASLLGVVRVENWTREQTWPSTELKWRQPSPNLPDFQSAAWYPGLALLEFSGLSVGRGTHAPFQILAAPWLDAPRLMHALQTTLEGTGVELNSTQVVPSRATFENERCAGVEFSLAQGGVPARPVEFGMRVMAALRVAHPEFSQAAWQKAGQLLGSSRALEFLWEGELEAALELSRADAARFESEREEFLIYG